MFAMMLLLTIFIEFFSLIVF